MRYRDLYVLRATSHRYVIIQPIFPPFLARSAIESDEIRKGRAGSRTGRHVRDIVATKANVLKMISMRKTPPGAGGYFIYSTKPLVHYNSFF